MLLQEIYPPKLAEFAYVTDGACTVDEITRQELLILQVTQLSCDCTSELVLIS